MNDKLLKALEKKGKKLDPVAKEAKMGVLKDLSSQAGGLLKDKLKGLKKVTVASDSKEGLEEGLDKAEELISGKIGEDGHEMEEEMEEPLEVAEVSDEEEDLSPEQIEEQIQKLQALKQEKLAKA